MSEETEGTGGGPVLDRRTEQAVQHAGERIQDVLLAAGILSSLGGRHAAAPLDIGRVIRAFVHIRDPRVRAECVSLIEALGGVLSL